MLSTMMRACTLVGVLLVAGCPHDLSPLPPTQDLAADRLVPGYEIGVSREAGSPPPDRGLTPDTGTRDGPSTCVCQPDAQRPCGPCNLGTEICRADCTGYRNCDVPAEACEPNATRGCGNCGTQICGLACSWRPCEGEGECAKGTKRACPNNCGEQVCSDSCSWGDCSKKDDYSGPSSKLCWSSNHCGPGDGRCVQCWLKCDADGNTYEDPWCAGAACQACSPLNDQC